MSGTYEVEYRVVTVKRVRITVTGAENEAQARYHADSVNLTDDEDGIALYSSGMPPVEVEVETTTEDDETDLLDEQWEEDEDEDEPDDPEDYATEAVKGYRNEEA